MLDGNTGRPDARCSLVLLSCLFLALVTLFRERGATLARRAAGREQKHLKVDNDYAQGASSRWSRGSEEKEDWLSRCDSMMFLLRGGRRPAGCPSFEG